MSQEENKDMAKHFYRASAADFMKIPGSPVAYWVSRNFRGCFEKGTPLQEIAPARLGMTSSDNSRFVRQWTEVSFNKVGFHFSSSEKARESGLKWFPYNKGGEFKKWYGNSTSLINWEYDGKEVMAHASKLYGTPTKTIRNIRYFFKPALTWSFISSYSFAIRKNDEGHIFDVGGSSAFPPEEKESVILGLLASCLSFEFLKTVNPTLNFQAGNVGSIPVIELQRAEHKVIDDLCERAVKLSRTDWNSYELSFDFISFPLLNPDLFKNKISKNYKELRACWHNMTDEIQNIERKNNRIFIHAYGLQDEMTSDASLEKVTLECNPHYRYGVTRSREELETLLQCDTIRELVSYAIGCNMGRYSLDKPGLIIASQGETLKDFLSEVPSPKFVPDEDAILPLTDQEWFPDDATNRFGEFVCTVWSKEHLQENLDFVAESLCLHAIKPRRGESALETIRRYMSTQFYKDHLRTYKKRPIYWLFSSGKQKAFECLVYLHRYNESTLARMRTEYVIPLSAKLNTYADKLEQDIDASTSTAETKGLEKEIATLDKQQVELAEFDEKLRYYADQRISLDLDDGVKFNYGKFGDLLAEVKDVTGKKAT